MSYNIYLCLTSLSMIFSRSIHTAANGDNSFYFNYYFIVYIYHIFMHSSVDGHLGCFHILTIVNSAAVDIELHASF